MGLKEYHRKRDFAATPEPRGDPEAPRADGRSFVVQKHAATRLHYDFRLEMEGVLKSWAVPKGPSLDPADKRLAMETEDHPVEYGGFEGVIPAGQYGGGTVVVWDRGTWEPKGNPHADYRAGALKFTLHGEKLKGGFMLVKIRGRGARDERSWLLFKEKDEHARPGYELVSAEPNSVVTGRSLEDVARDRDRVWNSNRVTADEVADQPSRRRVAKASPRPRPGPPPDPAAVKGARRGPLPDFVPPELATLVATPPPGDGWLHEMKLDGYRILGRVEGGHATLLTRQANDWTEQFAPVARALETLGVRRALLDGEVAVVLPDGTTSFQALQNAGGGEGQLAYFAFDLLHLDGYDLRAAPLEARKELLKALLAAAPATDGVVRYSDHVVGSGDGFFAQACRLGLEGIVSKRKDAPYQGGRGRDWQKVKCVKAQEVVIGGYTPPQGSRVGIGALLVGVHGDDGRLRFAGKVGTGFNDKTLADLKRRLGKLEQKQSPFADKPPRAAGVHWVRPELVAEVAFGEWTADGKMRHPSFKGLRGDKPATDVVKETPVEGRGSRVESQAGLAGVRITHGERVVYPEDSITKMDVARFYERIADWVVPHLRGRPTTLVRCPDGLGGKCFYQKHTGHWAPDTLKRVRIQEAKKVGEYLV
ncbi:MAG TPA: DNA ligase D, partial [Vicinamibacteria bacterium]